MVSVRGLAVVAAPFGLWEVVETLPLVQLTQFWVRLVQSWLDRFAWFCLAPRVGPVVKWSGAMVAVIIAAVFALWLIRKVLWWARSQG